MSFKKTSSEDPESKIRSLPFVKRYSALFKASLTMCLLAVVYGCSFGNSSPVLENINANRNPVHLSTTEKSWVGSVLSIGILCGALVSGVFVDRFGRQFTLMLSMPLIPIEYSLILASINTAMLSTGRALTGLGCGAIVTAVPVYLSEIAPNAMRGTVMAAYAVSINTGILLIYSCGNVLPWTWLAIICSAIITVPVLVLLFLPETPHWLFANGYTDDGLQALAWLRGHEDITQEFCEISTKLKQTQTLQVGIWDVTDGRIYKPLLISVGLFVLQVFSGVDFVSLYTVTMFSRTGNGIDPYVQTTMVGVANVLANFPALVTLDKLGRRLSLLSSTLMAAASMAAMGLYFKMKESDAFFTVNELYWLPLASVLLFITSYSFGLGPCPAMMTSEMLPTRARGIGSGIASVAMSVSMFIETKFALPLAETCIHDYGVFWIFSGILLIGAVFIYFCVPETKGKTLEEIEEMFKLPENGS